MTAIPQVYGKHPERRAPFSALFALFAAAMLLMTCAQTPVFASEYRTSCRCAPNSQEFCQGTLGDTDIFLNAAGTILRGSDSNSCRDLWEYEFSYAIDKIAIDTITKLVFFSSGDSVFVLSFNQKELVFNHRMSSSVKNISLQPRERLSIDLVNGERHYLIMKLSAVDQLPEFEMESPPASASQQTVSVPDTRIFSTPVEQIENQELVGPEQDNEQNLIVNFDNIAKIPFENQEYELNIEHTELAQITFQNPKTSESSENKVQHESISSAKLETNSNKNDISIKHDSSNNNAEESMKQGMKTAWNCVQSVALNPEKYNKNANIFINKHGVTMISMDYLISLNLCLETKIMDNVLRIIGPNSKKIVINNLLKTMNISGNKSIKFDKTLRPYRTAQKKYYIPLRSVLESAGYKVSWDSHARQAIISIP